MRGRTAHGTALFVAPVLAVVLFAGARASAQALPGQALAFDRSKGNCLTAMTSRAAIRPAISGRRLPT